MEPTGSLKDMTFINDIPEINTVTLRFNDTLNIGYKDTLSNLWENLWITFDLLLEDSRCAIDAVCTWEGNECLSFEVCKNKHNYSILLNTNNAFNIDTIISNYRISLIEVLPIKYSDSLYTPDDYVARISVIKQF